MTDAPCFCTHLDIGVYTPDCPVHRPPMIDYAAWDEMRDINVGLQEENDTLRSDLKSATASYRKALDVIESLKAELTTWCDMNTSERP